MDDEPYIWMFPCYALIRPGFNIDQNTGDVVLDEKLYYLTSQSPDGEQRIALFTDAHLADEYSEHCAIPGLVRLKIGDPEYLTKFLRTYQHLHRLLIVDPNPKTLIGRRFDLQEVAAELETWERGNQGSQ